MLKPYEELRKLDISKYTEKRDGMEYLNWAKCIDLLHQNGAEKVYFEPLTTPEGSSLFMSKELFTDSKGNTNRCYEVAIKVVVDDNEWIFRSPLMNGSNPVKDNSMSQQRVWNCQTRAFVKCIAIHTGLGFNLWVKEESAEIFDDDDLSKHNIMKVKERLDRLITIKMDGGLSLTDICSKLNIDQDQFNVYMKHYSILDRLEKAIAKL
jgi:hypothetical protein